MTKKEKQVLEKLVEAVENLTKQIVDMKAEIRKCRFPDPFPRPSQPYPRVKPWIIHKPRPEYIGPWWWDEYKWTCDPSRDISYRPHKLECTA